MNVSLYRCFESDKRISMDVYADGVHAALTEQVIEQEQVIPSSFLEKWSKNSWIMRYLRYQHYPHLVKKLPSELNQIHHVMDHGYAHLWPYLGDGKKVISVHDLIPLLTWQGVIKLDRNYSKLSLRKPRLNLYSLKFLQNYDHIITISQSTANDLQKYLNISEEKITVIPPVIDHKFCPLEKKKTDAFRNKYQLDSNIKWLMISGQEYYKNHRTSLLVLQSVLKQTNQPIKIIKTGRATKEFDLLVQELGLQEHVEQRFLESVDELPMLYNMIDCLLFPSTYEGFGMPVAEALACGAPVVMSNRAALPEVGGELGIMCEPFDVASLAQAVVSQLAKGVKQQLAVSGPEWIKQFRVDVIASKLAKVYK